MLSWRCRCSVTRMSPFKRWVAAPAAALLIAGGAALAAATPALAATCTVTAPTDACGPYSDASVYETSNAVDYVVQNDFSSITQSLTATDSTTWNVTANTGTGGDQTSVKSYPATQVTYTTTANQPDPSSDFGTQLTSSWTNTIPSGSGQDYEYAFDDWLGDPTKTSWTGDLEIMIWTYVNGQVPYGTDSGNVYTDASGTQWEIWLGGGATTVSPYSTISFVRKTNAVSGSIDRMGFYNYLQAHSMLASSYGIDQLNYGLEICGTGGSAKTYGVTGYSITKGSGSGAPLATTSAASSITSSGATLNGSVNPEGTATTYQFDYGTSTSYGTSVPSPAGSAGSGTSTVGETASLTGLTASTTYHYRIEATNSTGTTYGADQQFTTSAVGGSGTAHYDASGGAKATSSPVSWTQAVSSNADRALVAEVAVGIPGDSGCTVSVTDNGTPMTQLAKVHTDNQSDGFLTVWGLANPPSGTNAISASASGCLPYEMTGGSESFYGVSQSAPFGTAVTAYGSGATASVSAASASNDIMAGFVANGSPVNSATSPSTSRFIENEDNNTGAGNSGGATSPATGSTVQMKWGLSSDWWAAAELQVNHD